MSNIFKPYPSIGGFKQLHTQMKRHQSKTFSHIDIAKDGTKVPVFTEEVLPVLRFESTIKLHGTNAAIVMNQSGDYDAQSRTRILSVDKDNAGFCMFALSKKEYFEDIGATFFDEECIESVHIFGEWCGGSIQANVGLNGLEKHFIVFGVLQTFIDGTELWCGGDSIAIFKSPQDNIRNITEFSTSTITIDMQSPDSMMKTVDQMRDAVDLVCPVALALGSTGHGEGHVWRCTTEGYTSLAFKHKGDSHKRGGTKVKQPRQEATYTPDQSLAIESFLDNSVSVDRLAQGVESLKEMGIEVIQKNTGEYIKWVMNDIRKECQEELVKLAELGIVWKTVSKDIAIMSREFYMSILEEPL